ncbi:HET-domain-containing protein [Hyaloscypha variabilis F]|uniref:HET-domain-containing protein n=1 Tax=Hyaloscypha variabilis (strain UAMH 11265 / GT02V1 / F) TaxID=1149755 RepID=A0A2J6RHT0_HYAVF|nr:HET-domain-containing protein [Hyaloscypha variabilis F]
MATDPDYSYVVADVPVINVNSHFCFHCNRILERCAVVKAPRMLWRSDGSFEIGPKNSKRTDSTFGHKDDFLAFVASAENGCHLCYMLLASLSDERRQKMQEYHESRPKKGFISISEHSDQRVAKFMVKLGYQSPEPWSFHEIGQTPGKWCLMYTFLRPSQNPICDLQADRGRLQQDSTWEIIYDWVNTCNQHHNCIHQVNKKRYIRPTRLISVGELEDFSDLKLCRSDETKADAKYLTLSHCWGPKGLSFKLVKDREREFRERIRFENLPPTFKDAVSATRKLAAAFGVSYIWIDALCILQDSQDDWKRESSIMGDIYLNSFCNLAACIGDDSSAGLFCKRDLFSVHHCVAQGGAHSCFEGNFEVGNFLAYKLDVLSSVLLSRGWVLQETALAPRVLYFTSDQVFWKCGTATFEENRPREDLNQSNSLRSNYHQAALEQPISELPEMELDTLWADTVVEYSACKLTFPGDKLFAIAGLAKLLKDKFDNKNTYIAGLWTRDLFLQLLWNPGSYLPYYTGKSPRRGRPKVYRAPTWSWASIDNKVSNKLVRGAYRPDYVSMIDIFSVPAESLSGDFFAEPQSGALTIKGKVYRADLVVTEHEYTYHIKHGDKKLLETVGFQLDVPQKQEGTFSVYCLPVAKIAVKNDKKTEMFGLILQKAGSQSSSFERIGFFEVRDISQANTFHGRKEEYIAWQDFVVEHKRDPSLFKGDGSEVREEGMYNITIL